MLKLYSAPKYIDYLSIDTEGSEYEILKAFDFSQYTFGFISVEHNYSELRAKIHDLLVQEGYTRVLSEVSMWDDYYISKKLLSNIR